MNRGSESFEDLLIEARQGHLSREAERRLHELLQTSAEARALWEAGRAMDREASILPGDDARIDRIVHAVERRCAPRPRARWTPSAFALAGMLTAGAAVSAIGTARWILGETKRSTPVGVPSVASAPAASVPSWGTHARDARGQTGVDVTEPTQEPPRGGSAALPNHDPAPGPRATGLATLPKNAPSNDGRGDQGQNAIETPQNGTPARHVEALPLAPSTNLPFVTSAIATAPAATPDPSAVAPSAGALFAQGNRERVFGRKNDAIATYRRLLALHPNTPEAAASQLSLGMLYLNDGLAQAALEAFRACRQDPSASNAEEAYWGEARALRRLGRVEEERTVLGELVRRYPTSIYAGPARQRLSE